MKRKDFTKWLSAREDGLTPPDRQLDYFLELYAKTKAREYMKHGTASQEFIPSASHDQSFSLLNEIRNEFTHFGPKGYSVELAGLPKMCLDITSFMAFLVCESGTIRWHDEAYEEHAKKAIKHLREMFSDRNHTAA